MKDSSFVITSDRNFGIIIYMQAIGNNFDGIHTVANLKVIKLSITHVVLFLSVATK